VNNSIEIESVACPLCASDRSHRLITAGDWRHGLPGEFSYSRCLDCGLIYANPRVPPEQISRYYPNDYAPFLRSPEELRVFSPQEREQPFKRWRREALASRCGGQIGSKRIPASANIMHRFLIWAVSHSITCRKSPLHFGGDGLRLLDIGAGTGALLCQLHSLGWTVEGIEPDERALAACRESGLKVESATIETAQLAPESYDVVTMSQTLEHLADPVAALKKIACALAPGGLFVGNTPNAASLNRVWQKRFWWGYDPPRHYVVFSPKSLRAAFVRAGLWLRWHYCLSSQKGVTTARRLRAKARGQTQDSADASSSIPIPSFVLRLWVRMIDRLGWGDNLWFVGQKPIGL
jgi:2-polyprenyl-3-methyl-5-hydroxy-6-metoxy-1,4-benzoquinol methylase